MGMSRAQSPLNFQEESPDRFLRGLGFDAGGLAAKSARKAFLAADRRISVTLYGDQKAPEYILIAHLGGAIYKAIVQTSSRWDLEQALNGWRRGAY